jgi:hypothetical protein
MYIGCKGGFLNGVQRGRDQDNIRGIDGRMNPEGYKGIGCEKLDTW